MSFNISVHRGAIRRSQPLAAASAAAATMKLAGTIEATTHNPAHAEQLDALVKSPNPSKPQSELNS